MRVGAAMFNDGSSPTDVLTCQGERMSRLASLRAAFANAGAH